MKQFSIEFRKIESKVLTITSQKKGDIRMRTLQATCLKCRKTQETWLELVFSFSFRKEWRVFLNQSQSKMKRGRSGITFCTLLVPALRNTKESIRENKNTPTLICSKNRA